MAKKKQDNLNQASTELTQEQLDHIKNYGQEIKTIESFITGVRTLPGFYIGAKGNTGWKACIREIFQNAVDESLRKNSPCHYIRVTFDERNQSALIEDTGSGIPHGKIIDIYTTERSSSNYEKKPYEYTSGSHGVGSGVALALSSYFEVTSYVLGNAVHVEFNEGIPWKHGEKKVECPEGRQGTTVYMVPDASILGPVTLTCGELLDLVTKIFPMINIGDQIDFIGIDINGNQNLVQLVNKEGLITGLYNIAPHPIVPPICFSDDTGTMKVDVMFTYDSDMSNEETVLSYANFTPTTAGTHVDGFFDGLCRYLRKYINTFYLAKNSKITVVNGDIKSGLKAIVSAAHLYPVFAGQFKGILSNEDIKSYVSGIVYAGMDNWAKKNPGDLQKICKYIKDIAEIRMKSDDTKIKLSNQYQRSFNGKPKKFVEPSGKKNLELFIVEGDSAMGSAVSGRDPKTQGIFPIRGKLLNAFKTPKAKFLKNAEVAAIIQITTGGSYGREIDMSKVKWDKIIFMTDADPDGSHIAGLLLRLYLIYMPQLIEAGKVYKAVPPLFGFKQKNHMRYFTDNADLARYGQSLFVKNHVLKDTAKRPISAKEITKIFTINMEYAREMKILGDTLAVDPELLEVILFEVADAIDFNMKSQVAMGMAQVNEFKAISKLEGSDAGIRLMTDSVIANAINYSLANLDYKAFKKYIEKKYRFMKVELQDGIIVVKGLVGDLHQYVFLNEHTIHLCYDMIRHISKIERRTFIMDDKPATMYTVIRALDKALPNIKRFKGLGEQNANELRESTMDPNTRTLIRYTTESAKEEIENIRYVDSNRSMLLNGIKITRQDIE